MKKISLIFTMLLLLGAAACNEPNLVDQPIGEDGPLVTVLLNVQLPEAVATKAMSNAPQIESVWVAEFGAAGYFKRWVKAEPVDGHITTNGNELRAKAYTVQLPISGAEQRFHIIAGLYGASEVPPTFTGQTEVEAINSIETTNGQCAYWQRIVVPNGIRGTKDGEQYIVTPESQAYFENVPLVRNFAKVVFENAAKAFTVVQYALVNAPASGKVAPYDATTHSFVEAYDKAHVEELSFERLYNEGAGYKPQNVNVPKTTDVNSLTFKRPGDSDPYLYMYERPLPKSNPTCVLVELKNGSRYEWFKIELLDLSRYVPIYRDFEYRVNVYYIDGTGETSTTQGNMTAAQKALDGPAFGDVSASLETASLTTITDGVSTLTVGFTDYTSDNTAGETKPLTYTFTTTQASPSPTITVELLDAGSGAVIASSFTPYSGSATSGTVNVPLAAATSTLKKSVVRVSGKASDNARLLYRNINFRVLGPQDFGTGSSLTGGATINSEVTLTLEIPEDLGQSIFPLTFLIEAADNSLSATDSDLPVQTGTSPFGTGKKTFWFVKTLNYSDYYKDGNYITSIVCNFKRNKTVSSGSTTVHVKNQEGRFNPKDFTL